ncbi:Uncharacterised protein [Vibrio cholerae]|uniref:Uncharacterized protein n=1 Tax=Vibrio cholerae TaxID=666 RepID=A0A655UWR9_VIBCL|nr:Uncharacterised protein [Vibrio cholerae]CSB26821.1 Uncharacterised protein [Vibrio cholerae]CSB54683.1 Uncharacterised protein [Vibrio cholerae]CSB57383.1 Uncharacterised protein [Vibrio cholerae]CSB82260.1 Uncharacterised protein [Vibrio cholerae]
MNTVQQAVLFNQGFTRREQLTAQNQSLSHFVTAIIGMAHVVRSHIIGRFGDQVFEQIAIRLRGLDRLQRHAVFTQRGFHILERFLHAAILWQQIITQ